jgi:hypothetical protein
VPEAQEKTVTKICYAMKCKTICLLGCSGCCLAEECKNTECGQPREIHVLMKRIIPEKKCVTTCVPTLAPSSGCTVEAGACAQSAAGAAPSARVTLPLTLPPAEGPTLPPAAGDAGACAQPSAGGVPSATVTLPLTLPPAAGPEGQ